MGYKVHLVDPFYDTGTHLEHGFASLTETIDSKEDIDRILNSFFYTVHFSKAGKLYSLENSLWRNQFIPILRSKVELYRDSTVIPHIELSNKNLDIPYVYYYNLLFSLGYRPSFCFKYQRIQPDVPVFGLQIRQHHWKHVEGRIQTDLVDFYRKIFDEIYKYETSSVIYCYGSFDSDMEKVIDEYGAINLNKVSSSCLDRASYLETVNYSLASMNGFTFFCNYLALFRGNLRFAGSINDVSQFNECLHVRRVLSKGIAETGFSDRGFYGSLTLFPKFTVLNNFEKITQDKTLSNQFPSVQQSPIFVFCLPQANEQTLFSINIDTILIRQMAKHYQETFGRQVCFLEPGQTLFLEPRMLYVLTHYARRSKSLTKPWDLFVGKKGLDFNKLSLNHHEPNLSPDRFYYDDLISHFYRLKKKNSLGRIFNKKCVFISSSQLLDSIYTEPPIYLQILSIIFRIFELINKKGITGLLLSLVLKIKKKYSKINPTIIDFLREVRERIGADIMSDSEFITLSPIDLEEKLKKLTQTYGIIICEPSPLAFLISSSSHNNLLVLYTRKPGDFYPLPPSIFSDQTPNNLADLFDIHFCNLLELKAFLTKEY